MVNEHIYGLNPIKDFLIQSLISGVDLSRKEIKEDVHSSIIFILQNILNNQNDVMHLDFDIIGDADYIKLIGKNAISSLWFSGVFPENINFITKNNEFKLDNRLYYFNKKKCELTYKIIDEDGQA